MRTTFLSVNYGNPPMKFVCIITFIIQIMQESIALQIR